MKERGQGRPDQKFAGQGNSRLKEQGKASGFPNPQTEQGGKKSPERQPLPSVWDILKRRARVLTLSADDKARMSKAEYDRELRETADLVNEIDERGTDREKLISDLYNEITIEPANLPVVAWHRDLSPEEFQQFRSQIEPLFDEEICEKIRQQEEENKRKFEEFHKSTRFPPPNSGIRV